MCLLLSFLFILTILFIPSSTHSFKDHYLFKCFLFYPVSILCPWIHIPLSHDVSLGSSRWWHFLRLVLDCFSHSVMSHSLRLHGLQHARLPCPSPSPEFAQTHVHWVGDAIQPSHLLWSPSPPVFSLSQNQGLSQWVGSLHDYETVSAPRPRKHTDMDLCTSAHSVLCKVL